MAEWIFEGQLGSWLDNWLLDFTLKRWRNKYPAMSEEDFELQFRSRKDVCKRHSNGFQNKIIQLWQSNINNFEKKYNFSLST